MPDLAPSLEHLPDICLGFALVLCRVSAAVMLMPGLGEAEPPPVVRAGISLSLAILVAPAVVATAPIDAMPPLALALALVRELLCGFFIGLVARLTALALPVAAQMITLAVGLTSVIQPDPELGAQSSGLARLFSLAAPVLLLSSGLYRWPIEALATSYGLVPLGGPLPLADATETIVRLTGEVFAFSFRLAAPFVLAGVLWQVCLSLLGRLAPSLQPGAALAPGQILGGMVLLAVLSDTVISDWLNMTGDVLGRVFAAFHG